MKRLLFTLLCTTALVHAMQTPLLDQSLATAQRNYQQLLVKKSKAELKSIEWELEQGTGYFKDTNVSLLAAGIGLGVFAGWSASASMYSWKEASEQATGKNVTTGVVATAATTTLGPLSFFAIRAGWNYTKYLENQINTVEEKITTIKDEYPNIAHHTDPEV